MNFLRTLFLSFFTGSNTYSKVKFMQVILSIILLLFCFSYANAQGNTWNASFNKAKQTLEQDVYYDNRITIYCGAGFTEEKQIMPLAGFTSIKHVKRSKRLEWEHVVPAENFGSTFIEWNEGDTQCVSQKGKAYKGRKCAEKVNLEYKYMQADLYNLYPAIGSVNAMRSNYDFEILPNVQSDFGACEFKIDNRKAEPPARARGRIARTYQYMEQAYPRFQMDEEQRQLMAEWDKMYPVDLWECTRAKRIVMIQGNNNSIVKQACISAGLQ